jgi:hypothetical protein
MATRASTISTRVSTISTPASPQTQGRERDSVRALGLRPRSGSLVLDPGTASSAAHKPCAGPNAIAPGDFMNARIWLLFALTLTLSTSAAARDWYVSAANGKGKEGSKEKPAKDLGNIISALVPGDVVHIAGGIYTGKGDSGVDEITVPVSIIGGYDEAFAKRDPWGATRTVLSGDNKTKNYAVGARLRIDLSKYKGKEMPPIVVDGLIIDQGAQNRYKTPDALAIVRMANPKTGENPTPDRGGLVISVSKTGNFDKGAHWEITVKNNIVMNSAPTQGALSVSGYKDTKVVIENNAVINCTGTGIHAGTMFRGSDSHPQFTIKNNTVLFTWKYDAYVSSFSGNGIAVEVDTVATVTDNVIGFSDRFNVMKSGAHKLLLQNNLLFGAVDSTYYEAVGDMKVGLDDLEDEAEHLDAKSTGNVATKPTLKLNPAWAKNYGERVLIDRNAVEADIVAQQTRANEIRSILGLNQRADDVKADSPVWLHRMAIDDAIALASTKIGGKGSAK